MPLSQSHQADRRPILSATSVSRFAELVKKIETSATPSARKRKTAARKKLLRVIKEQHRYAKSAKLRAVAVTLTYCDANQLATKHISAFLDRLRKALRRQGHTLPYAWVLERAGQFHYHLILWLPRSYKLDFAKLSKWWLWGSSWAECCRSVTGWGRYMAKFDNTSILPKGAKLFGYGGLDEDGKTAVARAGMPRWLQLLLPPSRRAFRCPGGGWADGLTGEMYRSPFIWTPQGAILASRRPVKSHIA